VDDLVPADEDSRRIERLVGKPRSPQPLLQHARMRTAPDARTAAPPGSRNRKRLLNHQPTRDPARPTETDHLTAADTSTGS
jgi:hypothetical protein